MDKIKKLELLEDVFEMDKENIKEDMVLEELEEWDSMASLSLIVLMDDEFDKTLSRDQIKKFNTVKDILDFME